MILHDYIKLHSQRKKTRLYLQLETSLIIKYSCIENKCEVILFVLVLTMHNDKCLSEEAAFVKSVN